MSAKLAALALAAAVTVSAAHAAPLTGVTFEIDGGIFENTGLPFFGFSPNPFTVGERVSATTLVLNHSLVFEISESGQMTGTFVPRVPGTSASFGNISPFVFTVQTEGVPRISGFTLVSTDPDDIFDFAFGPDRLSFTENSLIVRFAGGGLEWEDSYSFTAQIHFAPVPLPATLPLLAAGLAGLALLRRRRTSSS